MDKPELTKADIANMKTALYNCQLTGEKIDRMKACGLDCSEQEERCQHLTHFLRKAIETYGPLLDRRA